MIFQSSFLIDFQSIKENLKTDKDYPRLKNAEREGFEPPVPAKVRLISNQVHSTTLPPLLCSPRPSSVKAGHDNMLMVQNYNYCLFQRSGLNFHSGPFLSIGLPACSG